MNKRIVKDPSKEGDNVTKAKAKKIVGAMSKEKPKPKK